jgi:hypothetical protein
MFMTTPSSLTRSVKVAEPREVSPSWLNERNIYEIDG